MHVLLKTCAFGRLQLQLCTRLTCGYLSPCRSGTRLQPFTARAFLRVGYPMSIQTSVCIFCAVFSACLSAAPVDTLTQTCAPCHGAAGVSTQVKTPHLNGQLADNLEDDIRRLASGTRPSSVTDHVPANWTVVDTAAVAQFSLPILSRFYCLLCMPNLCHPCLA